MLFDDIPVDFAAHQYTIDEAVSVSGVSHGTLRSWLKRESAPVGRKHPKLHRLFFSGIDLIRLRVMGDMIDTCGVKPSVVAPIADAVVARFWEMSRRDRSGRVAEVAHGHRNDTRLMVSLAGGVPMTAASTWDGETYTSPAPSRGHWAERFRRPHIVVPVDQIIFDVQHAIFDLHSRERVAA